MILPIPYRSIIGPINTLNKPPIIIRKDIPREIIALLHFRETDIGLIKVVYPNCIIVPDPVLDIIMAATIIHP
tara:strand:- start:5436 stop:5654 length:219 start_codon:yes stop_codon:yes gene_type:complete